MRGVEERVAEAKRRVQEFFSKMSRRPEEGLIELAGEPQLLVSFRSIVAAHISLSRRFGSRAAELALYRLGYEMGVSCCRAISSAYGIEDPVDRLLMGPFSFVGMGWMPYVDFLKAELEPGEGWLLLWESRSRYAERFLALQGSSEAPVCFMLAGVSAGWCSESFNLPLAAREVSCMASGGEACRFLVAHRRRLFETSRQEWVRAPRGEFEAVRFEF